MSSSLKKLHEVLEEEYVGMYGPLPLPEEATATDEKRLDNVISEIHRRGDRTALCISGGGIRSATFALGIIQGLARGGLLKKFDYVSTVSGGGYIGSWLSSWIRRDDRGVEGVEDALAKADTGAVDATNIVHASRQNRDVEDVPKNKLDPEPRPLRHLREYSNYLAPRLGLLSGDSWTLVAMYIRNLLLNLLVLVPLLAALLAIPRAFSWLLEGSSTLQKIGFDPLGFPWTFAVFVTLGFAYLGRMRPVDYDDEKPKIKNADISLLTGCVLMLTIASVGLAATWARYKQGVYDVNAWTFWGAGVLALAGMTVVPYVAYYKRLKRAAVSARRAGYVDEREFKRHLWKKRALEFAAVTVALAATVALWYLLAAKVFDDPLRATPQLAKVPPILRFFLPSSPQAQLFVCLAVPLLLLVFFVQASIFVGLSSRRSEDSDREWWARAGAWLVFTAVAVALLNFIAVFGPVALYYAPAILASIGGVAGVLAAVIGYSDKTPANQKEKEDAGATAKAGNAISALAVPLFVVFLLASISFATTWIIQKIGPDDVVTNVDRLRAAMQSNYTHTMSLAGGAESKATLAAPLSSIPEIKAAAHLLVIQQTNLYQLLIILVVAAFAVGLSCFIGVNKFSMNALYRNRLIRAYLGASRWSRTPDRFTGFDEDDNLEMWKLRPELLWAKSIVNVPGFIKELKGNAPLAAYIWTKKFDGKKREIFAKLEHERDPRTLGVLVAALNDLLLTETWLAEFGDHIEWIQPQDDHVNYSDALRNRAIFDDTFWRTVRVMPAPEGVNRKFARRADDEGDPEATSRGPMHVVNIALNLTSGENLAWQQRMAESLTVSPFHTGAAFLNSRKGAYRSSKEYGGTKGISLGSAVSISGAAASPNMGYHSSPVMAFLLTFFNIRLGAWLGNPLCDKTYPKGHPSTSLIPFLKEATGSSDDQSNWVYLSDGGHFENLGLYEMVLRRAKYIVVSDGGCDPNFTFEDLGNAIRKIRTDFGIPIDVYEMKMQPRDAKTGKFGAGNFVARARIRYSAIDTPPKDTSGKDIDIDGQLVYIKAAVYDDESLPKDVYNYAMESLPFPHESTGDQFFSESQFESYRALGRYAVNELLADRAQPTANARIPILKQVKDVPAMFGYETPRKEKPEQLNL